MTTPAADFRAKTWDSEEGLIAYTLDELLKMKFPARRPLLCRGDVPVFREGHLGEVYAVRGVGKTWFLQTLALVVSAGVEALGFRAPEPRRVLYIDGEMGAEEIQGRFDRLAEVFSVRERSGLTIVGADWQTSYLPRLDTGEGQGLLGPYVERADLVILDNRSCLFDPEGEKDPSAWQPAQDWLLSLRRGRKGVMLAHHSNRMGGARGRSKPEDAMDILLKLSRPDGYTQSQGARFLVEFEKARGVHGSAAAPFVAALSETGWAIEGAAAVEEDATIARILDYLILAHKIDERPKSASAAVRGAGVNRQAGLRAMAELLRSGKVVNLDGLRLA